jgi:hypothetical protein
MKNNLKEKLKGLIKKVGFESTVRVVGSLDKMFEIFDIKEPMDFLNLFNDLESVQSEERENWILYRYKKGHNLMNCNRKNNYVYINYDEIWSVLEDNFGLNYDETQKLTQRWLDEVYNLRGVTPTIPGCCFFPSLDEVYNLRGVTPETNFDIRQGFSWMRSTI